MDHVWSVLLAGLLMHAAYLGLFVAIAVATVAVVYPIRTWWRWHKRRLTGAS